SARLHVYLDLQFHKLELVPGTYVVIERRGAVLSAVANHARDPGATASYLGSGRADPARARGPRRADAHHAPKSAPSLLCAGRRPIRYADVRLPLRDAVAVGSVSADSEQAACLWRSFARRARRTRRGFGRNAQTGSVHESGAARVHRDLRRHRY